MGQTWKNFFFRLEIDIYVKVIKKVSKMFWGVQSSAILCKLYQTTVFYNRYHAVTGLLRKLYLAIQSQHWFENDKFPFFLFRFFWPLHMGNYAHTVLLLHQMGNLYWKKNFRYVLPRLLKINYFWNSISHLSFRQNLFIVSRTIAIDTPLRHK